MKNVESKNINLIGLYLGFEVDGAYIETCNHYHIDGNYIELNQSEYKKVSKFDFEKSIIKWNNILWKALSISTIFVHPKTSHRFEQINNEQDIDEDYVINIDSNSVANLVIIYKNIDPTDVNIQEIMVDNIVYKMDDYIGNYNSFYSYYSKKDKSYIK